MKIKMFKIKKIENLLFKINKELLKILNLFQTLNNYHYFKILRKNKIQQ